MPDDAVVISSVGKHGVPPSSYDVVTVENFKGFTHNNTHDIDITDEQMVTVYETNNNKTMHRKRQIQSTDEESSSGTGQIKNYSKKGKRKQVKKDITASCESIIE